jgi:hypothetical protein
VDQREDDVDLDPFRHAILTPDRKSSGTGLDDHTGSVVGSGSRLGAPTVPREQRARQLR